MSEHFAIGSSILKIITVYKVETKCFKCVNILKAFSIWCLSVSKVKTICFQGGQ